MGGWLGWPPADPRPSGSELVSASPPDTTVGIFAGLASEQSMSTLDVPVGTVKSRTYRAMRAMRHQLIQRGIYD